MESQQLNDLTSLLQSKIKKLDGDSKIGKLLIDDHCSRVKSKIDLQAEIMIMQINKQKSALLDRVEKHHQVG